MKKNIGKRILSLALALVLVVGLLPMGADAVEYTSPTIEDSGIITETTDSWERTFTFGNGFKINTKGIGCSKNGSTKHRHTYTVDANSVKLTVNDSGLTFSMSYSFTCGDQTYTDSISTTRSGFSCTTTYNSEFWWFTEGVPTDGYDNTTVQFWLHRDGTAHTGTATCQTAANCTLCGESYYADHVYDTNPTGNGLKHYHPCMTEDCTAKYEEKTYTQGDHAIIETCNFSGCDRALTITLPEITESYTYTGSEVRPLGNEDVVYSIGGNTIAFDTIPADDRVPVQYENNANAGTAKAYITKGGVKAERPFTINPASIAGATVKLKARSEKYTGGDLTPTVAVTYSGIQLTEHTDYEISCHPANVVDVGTYQIKIKGNGNFKDEATLNQTFTITRATPTAANFVLTPPTSLTYDGGEKKATVAVAEGIVGMGNVTAVHYFNSAGEEVETPTAVDTYTVEVDVAEGGNYEAITGLAVGSFAIEKATPTFAAPTANLLTYNGKDEALVEAGSVNPGKLLYRLDGGEYSETVPTATNAGNYTVYYKVVDLDTANYNEVPSGSVSVTIRKAEAPAITFPEVLNAITYGQKLEEVKLSFYENDYGTFNWNAPTSVPNAGTAGYELDFYPNALALQNYDWKAAGEAQWIADRNALCICPDVTVNKAPTSVTAPTPNDLTYNGEDQPLVTAGSVTGGTMVYSFEMEGEYTETLPQAMDAGTYTVWYKGDADSNHTDSEPASVTVEIKKADASVDAAPAAISGLVYNGRERYLITSTYSMGGTVLYSLDGINYTESLPMAVNAQEYTVYYKVVGDANHNDMEPKTVTAKIAPWNIETASCKAGVWGGPFTYNGQEHTPTPQIDAWVDDYPVPESPYAPGADVRLTEGTDYTVTYSNNVNAGEAVVSFTGKGNYTGTITRKFTIAPKPITVTIADKTSVYGEAVAELTATADGIVNNNPNVYSLATDASSTANAGTYPITGTTLDSNYAITFVDGTYTITKAQVNSTGTDMAVDYTAGMEVDLRQMFSVDENAGEVDYWITYLTGDDSFTGAPYLYRIDKAGTFTVKITTKETTNYKSGAATAVLTVNPGDPGIGTVTAGLVNNTLETSSIVLTRENTDIDGNLTVDAGQTLAWGDNTIRYTFTPNDTTNYKVVKGKVAVTVVDTVAPVGTVSIDDNKWNDLWNTITFGLFFKETKTVKVVVEDALSGIAKVEYYDSATALSADAVKAITAWTDMGADYAQDVTAEDAKTFIYYIRITDKAGNVTYISTADATYDLNKPVISGITNGSTYYTTQKVTVTDTNLDSVTLNGDAVTGEITLAGNVDKTYTIVATDKAGNETTCTVTMKAIASISAPIDSIGESNVNSGNTDAIAEVEAVAAALDTTNATDAEKAAIKAITDKCDALQEVVADTAAEYERITDAIAAYDPDEVTSADKAALDKLAEDLEVLAESGNLTDSEKTALETPNENLDAMIETVNEVTEESDRIADAVGDYDQETVKSSDKEEIEQLAEDIDALLDTDNLTDEERTALEGEKTKCENLLAKIEGTDALVDKLTEDVGSYDEDTVKSTDKAALEQLVEDIEAVIEGNTNITEEEKTELEALVDTVEALLTKIEEVAQAPVTEDTEKVEDTTSENVTSEDKEDLTNAKADLEDALTENAGNYTDSEKKAIQDEIDRIDDALEAIENVEAAEETVSKLPAGDKVEPDDEDAIKAITDAKAEYDALTDHEKSLVDEDTKKKLDDLCAALVAYDIIKGENGKYTQGGSKGLSFTANGAYSKFTGILVDNKVVDSKHYTAESGSTVITLKASYLDTLSTGKHTLTVVYTDGETSCEFNIAAKSATPATGDNFNILLWTSVMIISLAAITVLLIEQNKRRYVK